jgi:ABC-type multidrug transport system fused ATPase/permease subunit
MQLYEALKRVHLIGQDDTPENSLFNDLSSLISESGSNLSQGQQQLLCIARALLAASKVIVLDEATSAIDIATDVLIQKSIREWFTDRTMIVIAHRLSTVADFDKVLVLDGGRMVEFGTPRELWEQDGVFRGMCKRTGSNEEEHLRQVIMG